MIPRKWTEEKIHQEALKYNKRSDFCKFSTNAYAAARRFGILDKVCSHMSINRHDWTNEQIFQEALKYKTRRAFQDGSPAYTAALKRGILDQVCLHMKAVHKTWTNEELALEAMKYKTRNEFRVNSKNAYMVARRRGLLDRICNHMGSPVGGTSIAEQELFDIIKSLFPSAKKLIDRKVKIKYRPYIYGFHLDIYIPELNLGIEFDGKYHHTVEGLRRGRLIWPTSALRNYHEIKDSWFSTKNIKILHIGEKDWEDNKQACIDKCLAFLGLEQKKVA